MYSKTSELLSLLQTLYPDVYCELNFNRDHPYQLLIATRLSAQCTDKRVNVVTPVLFAKYPDIKSLAEADLDDIEAIIRSCGLFRTKARDIKLLCIALLQLGDIPSEIDDLTKLPGVGRKTANLVAGELFGKAAIVADTHVIRLSNRLGLVDTTDPTKVERGLRAIVPPDDGLFFSHRLVRHGRQVCTSRNPKCGDCALVSLCCNTERV
ncbi:MAG: endonuclease III [Oscillospiraceae bacterium]|jgi:endonuclease-3|nr:endonuclease III [Oscillospiraceae bacterium]